MSSPSSSSSIIIIIIIIAVIIDRSYYATIATAAFENNLLLNFCANKTMMDRKISSENTAAAAAAAKGGGIPAEVSFDSNSSVVDVNENNDDEDSDRSKFLVPAATAAITATSSAKVRKGMYETHNLIVFSFHLSDRARYPNQIQKDPLHPDVIWCHEIPLPLSSLRSE
jgi:hypothetical protein